MTGTPRRSIGRHNAKLLAFLVLAISSMRTEFQVLAQTSTVVTIWDFHVHDKKYKKDIFKEFGKANPDIRIEYTSQVAGTYQTILDAAFRSGTPPDLFVLVGVSGAKAIEMGWVQALDYIAPSKEDLRALMAKFPPDQAPFVENVNMFGGKVYSWPSSIQDMAMMLFWNPQLFKDAGLKGSDGGAAVPDTLDAVRVDAKKVTALGQGKIYGIVHGIKNGIWDQDIFFPATGDGWPLAGWGYQGFDFKAGRFDFHHPGLRAHIQNWLDMKQDGSILPGDISMEEEQAKFKFAQGLSGMLYGGYFVPGGLLAVNPDAQFDTIVGPTVKRGERLGGIPSSSGLAGNSEYYVSGKVKNKEAIWKVVQFLNSAQYLVGWVKAGGGFSAIPEFNRPENFPHPTLAKIAQGGAIGRRIMPAITKEAQTVWDRMEPGQPMTHETMMGMWIGKLGWEGWDDWERRLNEAFAKSFTQAQKEGIKVSKEDFIFPDWDSTKNYIAKPRKP